MSANQAQQPASGPSEPPELSKVISDALHACTRAKNLQQRLVKLTAEYADADKENILVAVDYYKELNNIIAETREVRAELQTYLMYLASKVPLNREDFLKAFTILNNVDFEKPESLITKPESLITTVLSDTFINTYLNLLLSVQTTGTTTGVAQSITFQIPVRLAQQGTGGAKQGTGGAKQ